LIVVPTFNLAESLPIQKSVAITASLPIQKSAAATKLFGPPLFFGAFLSKKKCFRLRKHVFVKTLKRWWNIN
jgi:hypothetical protein